MLKKLLSMFGGGKTESKPVTIESLQGKWLMVDVGKNGNFAPKEVILGARIYMTIEGDRYTVTQGGKAGDCGIIQLDTSKSPVTFDQQIVAGDDAGKKHLGIVRFVGDDLENCQAEVGSPRPRDFARKRTDGASLARFKRVPE
jgi:uncharacterized protein (TIGR03067 family)